MHLAAAPGLLAQTVALGPTWLNPDYLIGLGLVAVLAVVFVETGLLVGFFLPGDSLLFTAGLLINNNKVGIPLWLLLVTVPLAAIAGDQVGYQIGHSAGPRIFAREDSRFFKRKYVDEAYSYFERYGARTIVIARFVPIVRTFTPVVAGVSKMDRRIFTVYNVIGGVAWSIGISMLGYFLGRVAFVRNHLEPMILLVVLISVIPIGVELLRARKRSKASSNEVDRV